MAKDQKVYTRKKKRKKTTKHGKHYDFRYKGIKLDPYRILKVYGISDPAQQHIIKKALRAGRSIKSLKKDIDEIISSCLRWKEMIEEEERD